MPGFESQSPRTTERAREPLYVVVHRREWRHDDRALPRARFQSAKLTRVGYFFDSLREPSHSARMRELGYPALGFGTTRDGKKVPIPRREWHRFEGDDGAACVYLRRYYPGLRGGYRSTGGAEILGDHRVDGVYCAEAGTDIDESFVSRIERSVSETF